MISFKQYLVESEIDVEIDKEIKKKLADEAENTLKNSEEWDNMSEPEKRKSIADVRKKAEDKYDSLPEEDKQKHRDQHKSNQEKTNKEIDAEIKQNLADEAEKAAREDEFWSSKTPEEQSQIIKDTRKKAEDDYDNLSDEDKKKKREEYKNTQVKQAAKPNEPSDEDIDKEIKKKLADEAEEEVKKTEGFKDETQEYQDKTISDARTKAESDYDNLSDEDKKKKREEHKAANTTAVAKTSSTEVTTQQNKEQDSEDNESDKGDDKTPKSDKENEEKIKELKTLLNKDKSELTPKEEARIKELKKDKTLDKRDLTNDEIEKALNHGSENSFLKKLKGVDSKLSGDGKEGVYNMVKGMAPDIITIFALCCPIGALAIGGALTLGLLTSMTIKACAKKKLLKPAKEVIDAAKEAAGDDEDTLKELEGVEKSVFIGDNELATDEDFELNLEKNGLKSAVSFFKKNNETLDKEVNLDDVANAAQNIEGESKTEKTEPKGDPKPKELSDEDIEKMQDKIADLDPEKDKDKLKEMEDQLKAAAKKAGKDESEYLMKTDTDKDGNQRQKKTGPRGGKYYRVKGKDGWGPWNGGEPNESLVMYLQNNIYETCYIHRLKYHLNSKLN